MSQNPALPPFRVSPTQGQVQTVELGPQGLHGTAPNTPPAFSPTAPNITPDQVALPTPHAGESVLPACARGPPSIPTVLLPLFHCRLLPLRPDPAVMPSSLLRGEVAFCRVWRGACWPRGGRNRAGETAESAAPRCPRGSGPWGRSRDGLKSHGVGSSQNQTPGPISVLTSPLCPLLTHPHPLLATGLNQGLALTF